MTVERDHTRDRELMARQRACFENMSTDRLTVNIRGIILAERWGHTLEYALDNCTEILIERGYGMEPWQPKEETP